MKLFLYKLEFLSSDCATPSLCKGIILANNYMDAVKKIEDFYIDDYSSILNLTITIYDSEIVELFENNCLSDCDDMLLIRNF